jgi:mannose-6-phosphate isomerase
VSLIEVQQNSDITYRLYDYGRPRELHLDEGVAVAHGMPYPAELRMHVPDRNDVVLAEGRLFRLDQIEGLPNEDVATRYGERPLLVIPRRGDASIGLERIAPGGCGFAPNLDAVDFAGNGICLIAQPSAS